MREELLQRAAAGREARQAAHRPTAVRAPARVVGGDAVEHAAQAALAREALPVREASEEEGGRGAHGESSLPRAGVAATESSERCVREATDRAARSHSHPAHPTRGGASAASSSSVERTRRSPITAQRTCAPRPRGRSGSRGVTRGRAARWMEPRAAGGRRRGGWRTVGGEEGRGRGGGGGGRAGVGREGGREGGVARREGGRAGWRGREGAQGGRREGAACDLVSVPPLADGAERLHGDGYARGIQVRQQHLACSAVRTSTAMLGAAAASILARTCDAITSPPGPTSRSRGRGRARRRRWGGA